MKPLPWTPEDLDAMRLRLPAAISEPIDYDNLKLGLVRYPHELRRHVFDRADGLRLIFARIAWGRGRDDLLIYAEIMVGSTLDARLLDGRLDSFRFDCMVVVYLTRLGERSGRLDEVLRTDRAVAWSQPWNDRLTSGMTFTPRGADTDER